MRAVIILAAIWVLCGAIMIEECIRQTEAPLSYGSAAVLLMGGPIFLGIHLCAEIVDGFDKCFINCGEKK